MKSATQSENRLRRVIIPKIPKKKRKGSTGKGIVIGIIGTLFVGWTGVNVACLATNSQILITNRGSATSVEGSVLDKETVSKINELTAYSNLYYYDDIAIPCPQIVPLELYQSCHSKFKTRIGQASSYKATEKYLFSLKIQCGECGDMMVGECGYGKAGKRYSYYKCATRKRKGGKCKLRTFRKDYLEELVVNHTIKEVLNTEVMEYIADRVMEIQEKQTVNYVLKGLRKQYAEAEKVILC